MRERIKHKVSAAHKKAKKAGKKDPTWRSSPSGGSHDRSASIEPARRQG
jgi:hypothetical protein